MDPCWTLKFSYQSQKNVSDLRKKRYNTAMKVPPESQEVGHVWAVDNDAGCVSFLSLMAPSFLTDLRLKSWVYAPFRSPRCVETLSFLLLRRVCTDVLRGARVAQYAQV